MCSFGKVLKPVLCSLIARMCHFPNSPSTTPIPPPPLPCVPALPWPNSRALSRRWCSRWASPSTARWTGGWPSTRSASSARSWSGSSTSWPNYSVSKSWDFPGGPVVTYLSSNSGDMGLIPGWRTKISKAVEHLSLQPEPMQHNY